MFPSLALLESGLAHVKAAPKDHGVVEMIVRRPEVGQREIVDSATLNVVEGLVGDNWLSRGNPRRPDGAADPEAQVTLMNARAAELVAGGRERWALAGDQIYVDLDLSVNNLPPGTELAIGEAVLEVSEKPHTGCAKFVERFGLDATKFVNSPVGRAESLRGINAIVVVGGRIGVGDVARKVR
jgi:hypothetical protein